MGKRKTPEQIADEERRYALARAARTPDDFALLAIDPNQGIRAVAAMNPAADEAALARFAQDRFWGVRIEVAKHANVTRGILLELLEFDPPRRGVVHHAAKERLIAEGVAFDDDGLPLVGDGLPGV
ncbi:hypothetical protein [Microbacterium sp. PMB16]|uniref:hypothetical protein n=1 Tax=Microbacterium sp. PMB16 TaxID=3120157 RepID=UPI003F4BE106